MGKELIRKGEEALDDSGILDNIYVRGVVGGAIRGGVEEFLDLFQVTAEEKKEFKKERLERIKEGKGFDAPDLGAIGGLIETFTGGGESRPSCTCGENPHEAGCPLHVKDRIPIEVDEEDG